MSTKGEALNADVKDPLRKRSVGLGGPCSTVEVLLTMVYLQSLL